MVAMTDILDLSNPIFVSYIFWSTVMLLKMLAMAPMTGRFRFKNKSFANEEDAAEYASNGKEAKKPVLCDPDVERVRRAHLNDLENIPAFIAVAFFYMLTQPTAFIAINLFRIAGISRIIHTVAYVILQKQPHRAIAWFACYGATIYMAVNVLFTFM